MPAYSDLFALSGADRPIWEELRRRHARELAYPWLMTDDLRRLEFLAYYRATRGLRPAAPLAPQSAALLAEVCAYLAAPPPFPALSRALSTTVLTFVERKRSP